MPCCLCSNPEAPHQEQRRSAEENKPQTWHFCLACWQELERQRSDQNPEICTRYLIFLKYAIKLGWNRATPTEDED